MIEVKGNLWDYHSKGEWICITTNGFVKGNGTCVMGRGCAREAVLHFPDFDKQVGSKIKEHGNVPVGFGDKRIITFPVKHNWWEEASYTLIHESAVKLKAMLDLMPEIERIYIPRPGCGCGKLQWNQVKGIIEQVFTDDRFIIISFYEEF